MTDSLTERFPVDLGVPARSGVAVPHVVQVDFRETGRRGELLESSRDRIRVRRPAVLPAEQHAVIVVVGAEFRAPNPQIGWTHRQYAAHARLGPTSRPVRATPTASAARAAMGSDAPSHHPPAASAYQEISALVGKEAEKVDVASGDDPLSVRVRPSGLQRDCDRRATSAVEGFRRTYTRSHAGPRRPLRTLRPETKGQAGACPGWTRAIPCIAGSITLAEPERASWCPWRCAISMPCTLLT